MSYDYNMIGHKVLKPFLKIMQRKLRTHIDIEKFQPKNKDK